MEGRVNRGWRDGREPDRAARGHLGRRWALVGTIAADAEVANGGPINHVGALFARATGATIPASSLPTGFAKAVTILDEAVRGFRVDKAQMSFLVGEDAG